MCVNELAFVFQLFLGRATRISTLVKLKDDQSIVSFSNNVLLLGGFVFTNNSSPRFMSSLSILCYCIF